MNTIFLRCKEDLGDLLTCRFAKIVNDAPYDYFRLKFQVMNKQTNSLGFKELTKDNWKSLDTFNDYFTRINLRTGEESKVTDDERAEEFLAHQLTICVPINVRKQFETARGAMLYGCFFYPLFALGVDQLLRVAESAITHKCLLHSLTKDTARYEAKLKKLKDFNYLTEEEYNHWNLLRMMRNEFSYSKIQNAFSII